LNALKKLISECLEIEQHSLNDIEIQDIDFAPIAKQGINRAIAEVFFESGVSDRFTELQSDGIPCKGFWIQNTKDLVLFIWKDDQSTTIILPRANWAVRNDVTIH